MILGRPKSQNTCQRKPVYPGETTRMLHVAELQMNTAPTVRIFNKDRNTRNCDFNQGLKAEYLAECISKFTSSKVMPFNNSIEQGQT
jgi:hypothetical protein